MLNKIPNMIKSYHKFLHVEKIPKKSEGTLEPIVSFENWEGDWAEVYTIYTDTNGYALEKIRIQKPVMINIPLDREVISKHKNFKQAYYGFIGAIE